MAISAPSLPNLAYFPIYATLDGLVGYAYGRIQHINPLLTTAIFITRGVAETLFYHLAKFILKRRDIEPHKIFIATSAIVNMTFLLVLRELNLAAKLFPVLIGLAIVGQLINRVRYIQQLESLEHQALETSKKST